MKNFRSQAGFTLVELLVAAVVIAIISVVSTQFLFDTLTTRAKQYSITTSSEEVRKLLNELTQDIQEAGRVSIPNATTVEITGTMDETAVPPQVCKAYRYAPAPLSTIQLAVSEAVDANHPCTPPQAGFNTVLNEEITIDTFVLSPSPSTSTRIVNLEFSGLHQDNLGEHPFNYGTTMYAQVGM